ncbi:UPF0602 protein C4orf47 homolog, partial [Geodia barretti]
SCFCFVLARVCLFCLYSEIPEALLTLLSPLSLVYAVILHAHLQGEAYSDPVKLRRKRRFQEAKKNFGGSWIPSSTGKRPSGVGSHFGTFAGPVTSFSALEKPQEKYRPSGKNFLTNPGKNGSGYG